MAKALGPYAGARVLDIGCGLGGSARFLAANYRCRVTGIDLNESFIELARLLPQSTALDVNYELMDALTLGFEDDSFDFAWTQHVAMNIRDRAQLHGSVHIRTVAAWLGHKNVKTTMIYLKDARGSDIRRKVNGGLLATAFSPSISTEPRRGQLVSMAR
jgi:SAM-dependent methyltransferase